MTSSVSGQDERISRCNSVGYPSGKASPLGIRALSRKENLSCFGVLSHIINPLLTKLVRSRWLDIGLVLFFACLWTETKSRSILTRKKKNLANIQHLDRTSLVNNPYIMSPARARAPSARFGVERTNHEAIATPTL